MTYVESLEKMLKELLEAGGEVAVSLDIMLANSPDEGYRDYLEALDQRVAEGWALLMTKKGAY